MYVMFQLRPFTVHNVFPCFMDQIKLLLLLLPGFLEDLLRYTVYCSSLYCNHDCIFCISHLINSCLFVSASEKMQRKLRQRLKQQQFQHLMQHKQLQQQTEITPLGETAPLAHSDGICTVTIQLLAIRCGVNLLSL